MTIPKGKLIPIGGAEDKGTDLESGFIKRNNLNFFEQGILKRIVHSPNLPPPALQRPLIMLPNINMIKLFKFSSKNNKKLLNKFTSNTDIFSFEIKLRF